MTLSRPGSAGVAPDPDVRLTSADPAICSPVRAFRSPRVLEARLSRAHIHQRRPGHQPRPQDMTRPRDGGFPGPCPPGGVERRDGPQRGSNNEGRPRWSWCRWCELRNRGGRERDLPRPRDILPYAAGAGGPLKLSRVHLALTSFGRIHGGTDVALCARSITIRCPICAHFLGAVLGSACWEVSGTARRLPLVSSGGTQPDPLAVP